MPDIKPEHLLDRARDALPQAPGAPRQVVLRRGVSDAYYALFHELTEAVARQALRKSPPTAVQRYRRTLSHAAVKKVSLMVARLLDAISGASRAIADIQVRRSHPAMCAYLALLALGTDWARS